MSAEKSIGSGLRLEDGQAGAALPLTPTRQARKPKEDRHFVTALARGLEVLSCFSHGEITLSNQELAQRCKLPKSTVSRLTMTLTKLGYLIHVQESGRYRLGTACLALGSALLNKLDVRKIARPMMQELAEFSGASVSLGLRDKLSMIYVENCRSSAALTLTLDVGSRMPLSTSAMGRAWLAAVTQDDRLEAMKQICELDHLAWPKVKAGVDKALEDYKTLGVTCSFGDWNKEVNGVARAFDPGNGLPIMAVNVGGPSYNLSPQFLLDEVRPRLLQVVRSIENALPT
ncbi:DNA-binding IclR family transcriptional regulator [Polaromonas sp. CG_9.7]|nr:MULTISPECIES: IclR family transcriptional regulator [unclassified Polaromonas]MBG6071775.1 DNA-binding IclR family transcriptional regulator [Polaromonas sp. CG_9.7]MBG6113776.1 DNA-binding IclR family transcriptional regulator [Polaromonas sp. CG_9.2]MDH6184324.1 DNA-binding IclR family transcriptional regulator [Polaromonas sp. CG_23.6]